MKRILVVMAMTLTMHAFTQNTQPFLDNFRIENNQSSRVYFDSTKDITGLSTDGFTISGKTINGIFTNGNSTSGHYFTVSSAFNFWDNNTIKLENGNGIVNDFALQYIDNQLTEPIASINRYVTTTGNGDGTSIDNPASIKYAFANASSGQTWWIKAGNYGDITLERNNWNPASIIKFIGYKTTPGDIIDMYWNYGDGFDSAEMPTIDGTSGTSAIIIGPNSSNIIIRNFQARKTGSGGAGFYMSGCTNVIFDNVLAYKCDEYGLLGYGNNQNCRYTNSKVFGSIYQIWQYGQHCLIDNVYSHSGSNLQYLMQLEGNNNIIKDSYFLRGVENPNHTGHGINFNMINGNETAYNLAVDCEVMNSDKGVEFRKGNSHHNVVRSIRIYNNGGSGSEDTGGLVFRDGSHSNIAEGCYIDVGKKSNSAAIRLEDSSEFGVGFGVNNIVKNSVFTNSSRVFLLSTDSGNQVGEIDILNCTFDNITTLFWYQSNAINFANSNFKNNSVTNVTNFVDGNLKGLNFQNNNFYNSGSTPSGLDNISVNPNFENTSNGNYKIKSSSPLRGNGLFLPNVNDDFEGKPRPSNNKPDIGAFQFQDNSTSSIKADAGKDQTICSGNSATLTATGGTNYKWNSGETTASITVNPTSTTTYTVEVSDGTNSDTDEVIVTVESAPQADAGSDVVIESGQSITLTATGGDNYLWNTAESTASITVSPSTTTSYEVTVTKNGCESKDTVKVTVNGSNTPPSTVTADAGKDQTICSGNSATLTATGGTNYKWNSGETTASITVNPTSTTTYTVEVSDGTNSDTDEVIVTVESAPQADAGSDVVIESGQSITLTATGGDNYLWNTAESTASITVSPSTTTSYEVTVTKNGCESKDTVKVTVNGSNTPPSTVTADAGKDQSICAGNSATLTATGGTNYKWNSGETTASITVNPTSTTTYTVEVSDGTNSDTDEVIVTVESAPQADAGSDVVIESGQSITLTATGGDNYLWNTAESTASITVSPSTTTSYEVTVTKNGCESKDTVKVTVNGSNTPPSTVTADAGKDQSICAGNSATLTATGGTNYKWSTGETTASITVNPTSTTTYTVEVSDGTNSDTDEVIVTVESAPQAMRVRMWLSNQVKVRTLTATGGDNYLWNTAETTASITVSPTTTTSYEVTVTKNGCESKDTVKVTVNRSTTPPSTVTADAGKDQTICAGNSATLTATGGTSYKWSTGETTASITVNPTSTTTYTCRSIGWYE